MRQLKSPSPALLALTASALAALAPRAPAQDGGGPQVDYRFSLYDEADLPAGRAASGAASQRYEIQTHQFRVAQSLGKGMDLTADLTFEAMSGASPRYVMPGSGGRALQVMSGASIEDDRVDLLLGVTHRKERTAASLSAGYSTEHDYQAYNAGLGLEHELADRATTLSAGLGYSADTLEPTQGKTATGTLHDTRNAATAYVGVARILDAETVVQASLGYTQHDGYLSDPYKDAWIVSATNTVHDRRPDARGQLTGLLRLRHFFKDLGAAAHADYRYYHDDWQVDAHTVDLAWHQRLGASIRLVPGLRWYSQSQAFFYAPWYNSPRADGYASSDYRLSPYGALSASLMASADLGGWTLNLRYETYDSSADYALGQVQVESPGLVDFQILSLGVKKAF